MRKGYYIVLTHSYTPMAGDPSKMNCTEKCEFVDDIKNRMLTSASAILDVERKEMVKNRVRESTYAQYIEHVEKTHPGEYAEFKKFLIEEGVMKAPFAETPVTVDKAGYIEVA